jgi:hypothetical protein
MRTPTTPDRCGENLVPPEGTQRPSISARTSASPCSVFSTSPRSAGISWLPAPPVEAAVRLGAVAAVPDGRPGARAAAAGVEPAEAAVARPGAAEALALIPAALDAVVVAAVRPGAAVRLV